MVPYLGRNAASPSLRAANCQTDATFVGLVGAPAEWCHTQNAMRPRRPWGLRNAKLSPLSSSPGRPSVVVSCADQYEALPRLGAANSKTVATFGGSWEAQRDGVIHGPE